VIVSAHRLVPAFASLVLLLGCGRPAPQPIRYGQDLCDHCHMTISDPRFAGEIVTHTGRVYRFDDPACLAAFRRDQLRDTTGASAWVNDFPHPERLLDASSAVYVQSAALHTPMASGLAAFADASQADSAGALGGTRLTWADVLAAVVHEPHHPL
jgi:copper chaperone NosL